MGALPTGSPVLWGGVLSGCRLFHNGQIVMFYEITVLCENDKLRFLWAYLIIFESFSVNQYRFNNNNFNISTSI
jgi:hypothetical protein